MSSYWKEKYNNLTPQDLKKLHAAIDAQPTVSEPKGVIGALKLAYKQMNDVPAIVDPFPPIENFDLGDLDQVARNYEGLCKLYQDDEERGIASLAEHIGDLAVTASDETRSPDDRLAAELDIQNLNIHSKLTVPLNSCLRQVQLFNVEKRFGFVEESYQKLCNDDRKSRGEDISAETRMSFRQKWDNPFNLPESALKPRKKKEKKALGGMEALVKLQRNCKLAIDSMKELKETTSDEEKTIELSSVLASSTYADVPIPEDIPEHIRQRFLDAELAFQEVLTLQEEASKLLLRIRGAFVAWYSSGHEIWYVHLEAISSRSVLESEADNGKLVSVSDMILGLVFSRDNICANFKSHREFGKKRVHEMALFREYEYTRTSLHAQFYMASRQEVKIVEFYSSGWAPELPLAMNAAFRLKSMSLEEFEKDWVRTSRRHAFRVGTKLELPGAKAQSNP